MTPFLVATEKSAAVLSSMLMARGTRIAVPVDMQALPHAYTVTAVGSADGDVELSTDRVERLRSASPAEFGGPGDRWSPETLLVGALGDCLVLTFRAIARASKLPWTSLRCGVTGTLDRIDNVTQFTAFEIQACLDVPAGTDPERARRVLDKAEQNCLVARSLKAPIRLLVSLQCADIPADTRNVVSASR